MDFERTFNRGTDFIQILAREHSTFLFEASDDYIDARFGQSADDSSSRILSASTVNGVSFVSDVCLSDPLTVGNSATRLVAGPSDPLTGGEILR
jgi:hypothetical protein